MEQKIPMAEIGYGRPSNAEKPCQHCPELAGKNRTQVVYASNCFIGGLLVVGEAPGKEEDEQGEGFVGAAGCTLDRLLAEHKVARWDYGRANICRCRPSNNRKPTAIEIINCLSYLATLIKEMKPKVILAVGATAAKALCGGEPLYKLIEAREKSKKWSSTFSVSRAHKQLQPVLCNAKYVVPMPHTSSVAWHQRTRAGEIWKEVAARQVGIAVRLMDR